MFYKHEHTYNFITVDSSALITKKLLDDQKILLLWIATEAGTDASNWPMPLHTENHGLGLRDFRKHNQRH